jgi:hypothetical protein
VEERGEEAEEPRCRSPELARTDPHRTQPIIAKSSSTLLVSFPLLLFSPPQANPLYKAKNTRETRERERERERENHSPDCVIHGIERLLVPHSVQEDFNRMRSLRSKSAILPEGAPEVDPRTHKLKKPATPVPASAPPILPIYDALVLGLSLAPRGLQTPAWVWRDPRRGFC